MPFFRRNRAPQMPNMSPVPTNLPPASGGGILPGQPTTQLGERLRNNLSTMFGKSRLPIAGQPLTNTILPSTNMKKGGAVKKKAGGSVSSASKRADGCCIKGKTKGKMV